MFYVTECWSIYDNIKTICRWVISMRHQSLDVRFKKFSFGDFSRFALPLNLLLGICKAGFLWVFPDDFYNVYYYVLCTDFDICYKFRMFCVKFNGDASYVISWSDDTNLRLWKANASEQLAVFWVSVFCILFYALLCFTR